MNKKTHTSLVSLSHLLKWLINPAHSKLLTRNPKSSRVTRVSFTLLRNRATNDHIGRILKIVPSFHGKSGEGFQIFNFLDSGPFKSPTKPEISGCSVPRPCFQKKPPPNLHLNASGAQSRTLTSAWGFPRQSLSYEHFFLIMPEKVAGVLGTHQLTKRFNCPQKKGQLSLCATLIGAEVMKSEVPPQELCQPWSTGSLRLSTQENYTLKCMHAFGLGNSIFFFWLLLS